MNHRSNEELEGHMNTGIEWPVYAYVGQGEGEALKAMVRKYLEDGQYNAEQDGIKCENCNYPWGEHHASPFQRERNRMSEHAPTCLYRRLRVAVGLEAE